MLVLQVALGNVPRGVCLDPRLHYKRSSPRLSAELPNTSANSKLGLFGKEDFLYDTTKDCYRCPGDQELTFRFATTEQGRPIRYYSTSACKACPLKPQCTRNKENRRITRWVHETLLDEMQQRVAAHPEKVKARKGIVEHPFGTMKRGMDQGYFP